MLLLMRKRIGSIVIKVFAFFLILGFGAWGIQDMLGYQTGGPSGGVAEVGDAMIGRQELYTEVYAEVNRMRRLFGNTFDIEQARRLGVIDAVLNRQIDAAAILTGAEELGVAVSDAMVRGAIVNEPMFAGLAGNFDRTRFQEILQQNGLTEAAYVDRQRRDLATRMLLESIVAGVVAPRRWVDAVHAYRGETRVVDSVFVSDASISDVGEPGETDMRTYYKDHEKDFTAPEYRAVSFVRLDAGELAKETEVAEDDVRAAYDQRTDEFTTPAKRRVQQMIMSDEAKAKEAFGQLTEGKDFAAVAKAVAGLEEAALDLGEITEGDLLPELAGPVFKLAKDQVSEPLKSSLGWHLFKVTDVTPGGVKSFAEAKDELRNELALEKAVDAIFDLSNRFEDELGGGASIAEAAGNLGLKVEKLAAIDRDGRDAAGQPIQGLPAGAAFAGVAFATNAGEDSAMTEAGEDGFYILHVDKITKPVLRPFDTVKGAVAQAWKAEKRRAGAQALANTIAAFVNDGNKLADGAKDWGLAPEEIKDIARAGSAGSKLSPELIEKIFQLTPGKAAMDRAGEGYRVAVLKQVVAADAGAGDARKTLAGNLADGLRADLDRQLVAALRDAAGVSINRNAVESLFGERQGQAY